MALSGAQKMKRQSLKTVVKSVENGESPDDRDGIEAELQFSAGLSAERAEEWVDVLVDTRRITVCGEPECNGVMPGAPDEGDVTRECPVCSSTVMVSA